LGVVSLSDQTKENEKSDKAMPGGGGEVSSVSTSSEAYNRYISSYWDTLGKIDISTFENTRRTFDFSIYLGWILAFLGTLILVTALIDMHIGEGVNWENTLAGAIGLGAIIAQFFKGPQNRVTRSLGDYVQIQIVNNTYTLISQAWNNWDNRALENRPPYSLPELDNLIQILVDNSIKLTSDIETTIGKIEAPHLKVTSMTFEPREDVKIGDEVKVAFRVTNLGSERGSETFTLYLNDVKTDKKKEFTLEPGGTDSHEFKIEPDKADKYSVKIGGMIKELIVTKMDIKISDLEVQPIDDEHLKRQLSATFTNTNDTETTIDFEIHINEEVYGEKWNITLPPNGTESRTKLIDVKPGEMQKIKVGEIESEPFSVTKPE